MKKGLGIIIILVSIFIAGVGAYYLFAPNSMNYSESELNDLPSTKVVDVMFNDPLSKEDGEKPTKKYYEIRSNGYDISNQLFIVEKDKAFAPAKAEIFTVETYEDSYTQLSNERFLKGNYHIYKSGKRIKADETVTKIITAVAKYEEHEIFDLSVWKVKGFYFAFYDLNVNWWLPCVLLAYNEDTDELTELYTWDDKELIGLDIPDNYKPPKPK